MLRCGGAAVCGVELKAKSMIEEQVGTNSVALENLMNYMEKAKSCSNRYEVLDLALRSIPNHGLICEFGVFEGASINYIAKQLPHRSIFGFDSFEGLPEDWRPTLELGAFSTGGCLPQVQPNVTLFKGWFDVTLPGFAAEHPNPIAFLHIDCDLYSSTKCIFQHLGSRLVPGSIIVFDEFFNYPGWEDHEFRAFSEFAAARPLKHEYLAYNSQHEQVAICVIA
jgi:predicted O-methyltransferase YrrM